MLEPFFYNSQQWYHVRELARQFTLAPTTVSKYLQQFAEQGILERKEERHHLLFRADTNNPLFQAQKIEYNLQRIQQSGIVPFLEEKLNFPRAIIVFGSYAKGENTPQSDLDLFVLTETITEPKMEQYETILKAPIQLFIYTTTKFKMMRKKNPELFNNIVNGIKLRGFIEIA